MTDDTRPVALETTYAGCRFRSRIEARWAVFFTTLRVEWAYEPEAYSLITGNYLPDFWLPSLDAYIEIKGEPPTGREHTLCAELANATGKDVYLFAGHIPYVDEYEYYPVGDENSGYWHPPDLTGAYDVTHRWCVCPTCGRLGIQFNGLGNRICQHENTEDRVTDNHKSLILAYNAARSYRFEPAGHRKAA